MGHNIVVTQTRANVSGEDLVVPDGQWDIMAYTLHGNTQMLLFDQPLQGPVKVPVVAGQQQLIISFHAGSYIAKVPRSKRGVHFLLVQNNQTFQLADRTFPIPTFDTVEDFTKALIESNILVQDRVVTQAAHSQKPNASTRTVQRQFRHVTGMTPHYYAQAVRARQAFFLLQRGEPAITVAHELGYTDQFHMTHALKRFVGKTPREIKRDTAN
ncbi:MAG TPA: helix-turn-helix domain-containing protein [Candidatus Saccharimonadales bacterium]